ncbi:hypothetical protein Tco_0139678 [Tanacetum coccineum]
MDFKPSFPPINLSRSRLSAQPKPFLSKEQVLDQLSQYQEFDHHIEEAIQNAQNVQNSLLPPFTTTSSQMPPPHHFTTNSTTTKPPFRSSLPPSSTFVPLDQSLWIEGPPIPSPQEQTCPHCQRTETIIDNLQNEMRFMLNHLLKRLNHLSNQQLPIQRIQDFDELKDHCLTLKNTPYPHQRYAVYNTLVNKEEPTDFTSIRRIHQEDTPYSCLHFIDNHKEFKSNTPYPGTSIRRIQILLYMKILEDIKRGPYSKKAQYDVKMDDPNITMEEYIWLEEEKARKHGKVYNWETATYGKIWDNKDVHDPGSVETEFPTIVFNDMLTSETTLSCEPTVSSLNNDEIDFRISFDKSDDEDCMVIFDKKSFFYQIISVNDLKTDSENDNDKVNMPLLPSPEPTVSYFDDLDYFKDFEKEFPAIVYNDSQTSKLDFLTEPTVSPQHIGEFNLKDETSLSECEEKEQNVLYFNDLFPFNVIYPDDSKSDKDNDDDKINFKQSSGGNVINNDDGAYAQSTVYMAYSLNEYNVFDTGFNTTYPGEWIRRIDLLYSFRTS